MVSSGMLRRVPLVRTDVSEELSASFIRVKSIGKLGTTLAVTSNRRTLRRNTKWRYVPPKCRFLQELHGATSQNTPFFIVTSVKTSNLAESKRFWVSPQFLKINKIYYLSVMESSFQTLAHPWPFLWQEAVQLSTKSPQTPHPPKPPST
jgi:hypothetical protein